MIRTRGKFVATLLAVMLIAVLAVTIVSFGCAPAAPAPGPAPAKTVTKTVEKTVTVTPTPAAPIVIRRSEQNPPEVDISKVQKWHGDEIERRTGGRVKFEYFWASSLAKPPDALEAAGQGVADMAYSAIPYTPSLIPLSQAEVTYLPDYIVDAIGLAYMELFNTWGPLIEEFEKNNVVPLHNFQHPPSIIASNKPINKPEDLDGMKIRSYGAAAAAYSHFGAIPVAVASPEMYEAMMRGTVDGLSNLYFGYIFGTKLYEVTPYVIDPGVNALGSSVVCMNKDVWDSLTPDIQQIFREVSLEVPRKYAEVMMVDDASYLKSLDEFGITITRFSEEDQKKITEIMPGFAEKWIEDNEAKGIPAREMYDRLVALTKKYLPQSVWSNPLK